MPFIGDPLFGTLARELLTCTCARWSVGGGSWGAGGSASFTANRRRQHPPGSPAAAPPAGSPTQTLQGTPTTGPAPPAQPLTVRVTPRRRQDAGNPGFLKQKGERKLHGMMPTSHPSAHPLPRRCRKQHGPEQTGGREGPHSHGVTPTSPHPTHHHRPGRQAPPRQATWGATSPFSR